jgi:hypothetical protein
MPLGKLSRKQIENAYKVLSELQQVKCAYPVKLIITYFEVSFLGLPIY